jgi:hypothetical protein
MMIALLLTLLPLFGIKLAALPLLQVPGLPTVTGPQSCGLLSGQIATTLSSQEPWYCPISTQITNNWEKWLPVMLIVSMISFLIAAVIFMVGVVLGSAKIRNYGAAEFYEAIATAIMVVAFVYICAVVFGLGPGNLVGNINPYARAFNLIGTTIASAQGMYSSLYSSTLGAAEFASVTVGIGGPGSSLTRSNFAKEEVVAAITSTTLHATSFLTQVLFINPASVLSQFLIDGMAVLYAEYYLLVFFSVAAIPCFLIPGIIFRALLPTRGLGGVMIAMAIGFYLVMPALFATVYYFTAPQFITNTNIANAQLQSASLSGGLVSSSASPLVQDLNNAQAALSGFWMLVLFYPAMIVAFTYSFIVQLSKLIGGTYQSGAQGRLRSFI